jgi:hypothetical protein
MLRVGATGKRERVTYPINLIEGRIIEEFYPLGCEAM